ncbi:hypothetical protein DFQ09_105197 [Winogradskyella pacifica]|uniref:NrS-1 polymerase-like helicase domain-containing protein n=1 Tax=Winogradskyella pacifica TaxID=664642 RepID=A0A3D9MEK2_9FLAO|nr:DUF5906 domain-containing protein [Winogradskyella pacifica]REE16984.1 hypothetical protein DFQ09_105197 [Winogradskyella pacifica]
MEDNTNNPNTLTNNLQVKGNDNNTNNQPLVPLNKVVRISTSYYQEHEGKLINTNEQCIKNDYGKDAPKKIRKYFGFKNEPDHTNHKTNLNGYYNLYTKLPWTPEKGNWNNIEKMLSHVFKGDHYNMILTYFFVLYCHPKHPLPVIGLVGGKNTGKSKFLELILKMFNPNSSMIDPEDLTADFNKSILDKLLIAIDEKTETGKEEQLMQRVKKMATGGTQTLKEKFKTPVKIDSYVKIIMASNGIEDMLKLENENTRFWIVEVQPLKTDDFDILEKSVKEIPAFFNYLVNEYTPIERASRLWLDPKTFQTDVAKKMQANARPQLINAVIENLTNYFLENETKNEVYFTADQFISAFGRNERYNSSWFAKDVKKHLNKKSYAKRGNNPFHDIIIASYSGNTASVNNDIKQRRYYHFTKKEIYSLNVDFEPPAEKTEITDKEIQELFN